MTNLLTPELFNRLLCFGFGAIGAAFVIIFHRQPQRQLTDNMRQWPGLPPAPFGPWHLSRDGAEAARKTADELMDYWKKYYGIMSDLQAVTFAVTILSHPNVKGWGGELDNIRRNILSLTVKVIQKNQRNPGRNGAGGAP